MKGTPDAPRCGFSRTLVGLLRDEEINFETFDILEDPDVRQDLKDMSNWPTYPQVSDCELLCEAVVNETTCAIAVPSCLRFFCCCCWRHVEQGCSHTFIAEFAVLSGCRHVETDISGKLRLLVGRLLCFLPCIPLRKTSLPQHHRVKWKYLTRW